MMSWCFRRPVRRRGVAAVELAVLLPLIVMLLIGIWELGRMIQVQQALVNAAREAARHAATGQYTNAQCQTVAIQYLNVFGLPTTNANATVIDQTHTILDVTQAKYLDHIQATVTIPYQDVRWSLSSYFVSSTTTLQATAIWVSTLDQDYPSDPEPPQG
jgi:Flp pilus assembly protein TadG